MTDSQSSRLNPDPMKVQQCDSLGAVLVQTPEDLPTVFKVVEVKDTTQHPHVIRNVLLDWTSAERQLLVEVQNTLCTPFSAQ